MNEPYTSCNAALDVGHVHRRATFRAIGRGADLLMDCGEMKKKETKSRGIQKVTKKKRERKKHETRMLFICAKRIDYLKLM